MNYLIDQVPNPEEFKAMLEEVRLLYEQRQAIDAQLGIARAKLTSGLYTRGMQLGDELQVPELNYAVQLRQQKQQRINRDRLTEGLEPYGVPTFVIDDATDIHETAVYAQRRVLDKGDKTPDATGNGSSNGSSDRQFSVTTN
jgi:hypothetical protein